MTQACGSYSGLVKFRKHNRTVQLHFALLWICFFYFCISYDISWKDESEFVVHASIFSFGVYSCIYRALYCGFIRKAV